MKPSSTLRALREAIETAPAEQINIPYGHEHYNNFYQCLMPREDRQKEILDWALTAPGLSPNDAEYEVQDLGGDNGHAYCLVWKRYLKRIFKIHWYEDFMSMSLYRALFNAAEYQGIKEYEPMKQEIVRRLRLAEVALVQENENPYKAWKAICGKIRLET